MNLWHGTEISLPLCLYLHRTLVINTSIDECHFVQYKEKIPLQPKQIFVADKLFFIIPP